MHFPLEKYVLDIKKTLSDYKNLLKMIKKKKILAREKFKALAIENLYLMYFIDDSTVFGCDIQ